MKALCIAFNFQEITARLAIALAQHIEVGLMLPRSPDLLAFDWRRMNVDFQPFDQPRLRQPIRRLRFLRWLLEHIRRFEPDVLHLQQGDMYFSLALPLLRRYPLVISIHDPQHHMGDHASRNHWQPLIDFGFRQADQIIVHSAYVGQEVIKRLHRPPEIVHVVPHIEKGDAVHARQVAEAGNEILFFGRIWEYKGLEYLIRAEARISAQIPNAKIVIAGRGEDFARYERMMSERSRFVVHNEYIAHDTLAELFGRASVVVLPYIEATQSGVIPVAYSFAKPVVATTVGGLPSQVEHGHTGLLVPPRDEQQLADAVIRLMRDKQLRQRLGANGKRKLEAEWAAPVVARQTLPVYERAIASAHAAQVRRSA